MKDWILFGLFFLVGLGMLIAGIVYLQKEKSDADSVRIYRTVSVIGAVLAVGSAGLKFFI